MGRHSDSAQGPFLRSIIIWALPWVMIAAVVLAAVVIAIDALGNDDLESPPTAHATRSAKPEPTPTETPDPVESESPEPKKTSKPPKNDEKPDTGLITEDITVQVLNGTAASQQADEVMADRLSRLGYDVVAIEASSKQYARTTVFWSFPGAQEAAERLAERFDWIAQPKPSNLSSTVDLHVVVGEDEA